MTTEDDTTYSQSTYGILAILSEGARSGYEIKKFLSSPEVFYWRESYGNIYPILRRLKANGLVRQIDADVKRKRRIYYELTDEGKDELTRWLTEPPELSRFRVELLMKLRFGEMSGIDTMKANIEHYGKLNSLEIDECRQIIDELERSGDKSLQTLIRIITTGYLLRFKKSCAEWCTESIEMLDEWSGEDRSG